MTHLGHSIARAAVMHALLTYGGFDALPSLGRDGAWRWRFPAQFARARHSTTRWQRTGGWRCSCGEWGETARDRAYHTDLVGLVRLALGILPAGQEWERHELDGRIPAPLRATAIVDSEAAVESWIAVDDIGHVHVTIGDTIEVFLLRRLATAAQLAGWTR